ncbi:hypothetical protein GLAREA_09539 [Glarea lozoyensis ATCC 20868]|uniref:Uncharacterized protein n=1 Tax=Glarea lozoyensis (strain ATCC 20868 / MF5171) TaxID=1116229 RepID=S3CTR6_GLAL2|nr:uncharacterized protein GLAREA_09539 [Glarea lozoyensis ATCC 20868]EPE28419.1 hypothetical protein GLAREA_09539 [Glarea lozoyensis ATCC 20868]
MTDLDGSLFQRMSSKKNNHTENERKSLVYDITTKYLTVEWLTLNQRRETKETNTSNVSDKEAKETNEPVDLTYYPYPIPGCNNHIDVRLTAREAWEEEDNHQVIWHRVNFSPWRFGLKRNDRHAGKDYTQTLYIKRSENSEVFGSLKRINPNGEDMGAFKGKESFFPSRIQNSYWQRQLRIAAAEDI